MESRVSQGGCDAGDCVAFGLGWRSGASGGARRGGGNQVRRLLAVAAVYEGKRRSAAARAGAMDRQRLREWVHRFNAEGPAGVVDRKAPGAAAKLSPAQGADLAALIDAGPAAERDGAARWRCGDLQTLIQDRWGVSYPENSVGRLLKRLGCRRLSACPRHLGQDPAAIEAVTKDVPTDWPRLSPHAPPARQ